MSRTETQGNIAIQKIKLSTAIVHPKHGLTANM